MRILAFTLCQVMIAQAQGDSINFGKIASLIKQIGSGDQRQIVRLIHYPLGRPYPLKSIENQQECLQRFDEVFDKEFLSEVANSNPQSEDWQTIGWRGIAFKAGSLWLDDDYKILCVNYETDKTKKLKAAAIANQKLSLPIALRDFDEPVFEWKTSKYIIRVDRKKGEYRLVLFDRQIRSKIIRVLHNGLFRFDGNMGAFLIDWQSKGKTYRIFSGNSNEEDCYYVYDSVVDQANWPDDRPILKQKRQLP